MTKTASLITLTSVYKTLRHNATRLLQCLLLSGLVISSVYADNVSLTYDPVGNIASRSTSFGSTTYSYDALNRLSVESGPAGTQSYSYDANGNRLSDGLGSYTYSPTSNRISSRHGQAITTDAAGNVTADGQGHSYVYNQRGYLSEARLYGVLLANYYYDYRGLRTRKVTTAAAAQGAQTVIYIYDEAGHLLEELTATGAPLRTYIWRDDTPLAQIDHLPTRHIRYFETDHLNTPRAADAFGNTLPNENPSGLGSVIINLRFPGQYYDQETGLHYNWHRYYHPGMGQYMQPDPIGLRGGSFSTYAYVGGNPLRYTDPRGLNPAAGATAGADIGTAFLPGVGTVVGATIGAAGGYLIADQLGNLIFAKPPENAYDPNGPKAPGKPGKDEGFCEPKGGDDWIKNPNGRGSGWRDDKGDVWVPTGPRPGEAHGGPHWDVQTPGRGYTNIYLGGNRR